jgi:redox-regulated HSP33 family molecular chaperone
MGAFEMSPDMYECTCSDCRKSRALKNMMKFNYDNIKADSDFEDDQYIICPARFLGYVMSSKSWAQMPVDSVNEIKQKIKVDAFEKLIMDEDAKQLIRGLVANHEKKKISVDSGENASRDDWLEGKGRGLVILLHGRYSYCSCSSTLITWAGPPGVGKTSTAGKFVVAA